MLAASVQNTKILKRYISIVQDLYKESEQGIMGSIVFDSFPSDAPKVDTSKSKHKANPKQKERHQIMFHSDREK